MKVLILGGLGYLGGRLAEYLSTFSDYQLTLTSRTYKNWQLPWSDKCKVMQLDLNASCSKLQEACQGIDAIVHMAALNDRACYEHPNQAFSVNCLGAFNLIEAAKTAGVRRFIYLSTAHVYGSPLVGEISETVLPRPYHPYAWSHKIAEDLVLAAHGNKQLEGIVLRLSNGFGAPVDPSVDCWRLLLNDVAKQIVQKNQILLRSSGEQYRDFIAIHDVARSIKHMLELPAERLGNGLYNLGGEHSVSLLEMISSLSEIAEEIFQIKPTMSLGSKTGIAQRLFFNIDKIKSTGFIPEQPIKQELQRLLQFCKKYFNE